MKKGSRFGWSLGQTDGGYYPRSTLRSDRPKFAQSRICQRNITLPFRNDDIQLVTYCLV